MPRWHGWKQVYRALLPNGLVASLLLFLFLVEIFVYQKGFAALSPKAELFWKLEGLLAQGEKTEAKSQAANAPELAKALWQELLFDRLGDKLDEEPAPLSPRVDEVIALLHETIPDETLKRLWDLTKQVQKQANPFSLEAVGLEGVLARFVVAHFAKPKENRLLWQEVIKQCEKMGLELGMAFSLHELARLEREAGNPNFALSLSEQARILLEQWKHQRRLAGVLNTLGVAASMLGLFEQANHYLNAALSLERNFCNPLGQAKVLNNLGILATQTGAYREMVRNFQQALELIKPLSDKRRQVIYLNNLGTSYAFLNDYEEALRIFHQVLDLAQSEKDLATQAFAWNNMGDVYRSLGDLDQALYCLQQALAAAKATDNKATDNKRLQALILLSQGIIYREKEEIEQALKHFQETLELYRNLNDPIGQVQTLIEMGITVAKVQKKFSEGRRFMEEAFSLAQKADYKPGQALALLNIGSTYDDEGFHDRAIDTYAKTMALLEAIGDELGIAWCFLNIGKAKEELGKKASKAERERLWTQALKAYQQAVALVERIRQRAGHELLRAEFMKIASEPLYRLVNLMAQMGRKEEAFEIAEQARAQALLDALRRLGLPVEEQKTEEEQAKHNELQRCIVSLEEQIIAELMKSQPNTSRIQELRQGLEKARAEFERLQDILRLRRLLLVPQQEPVTQSSTNHHSSLVTRYSSLPPDIAVLSYIVTEQRTWLFVLYRDTEQRARCKVQRDDEVCLEVHPIDVPQSELLEDVLWMREGIIYHRPIGVTAQRLHSLLIAPALKAIEGKRWLSIIPDGILYALPFQALQDEDGRYLLEKHTIFYTPSLNLLWELQRRLSSRATRRQPFLWTGLGNPKREAPYPPLPYAAQEVQATARLLSSRHSSLVVRYFLGEKATEELALKALKESRWTHFAVHTILETQRPLYSRLVFAPNKTHDGFLRAFEVLDVGQIASEMVVLSACETGRGRIIRGEGMLGLSWSFLASGAQTLIVSQWQVDDMSTAHLMTAFYKNLLKKLPPAEALRQAQLEILRHPKFVHLFHWAAFIVMGQGQ